MLSLGLDVGGANTKAILLKNGKTEKHWLKYIPLWKEKEGLSSFLRWLADLVSPNVVGATMTGELSDVFGNKREGVIEIIDTISEIFGDDICYFMSLGGTLLRRDLCLASPLEIAAANWVASALIVGRKYPNCLLIDVGSTTTDIIPVKEGKPISLGKKDLQRLKSGELIYTGVLRTPLPYISSEIELGQEVVGVASENFAIMADVYRTLDMIGERDYTCEAPDGRGKDKKSCMRRIARVFCSDLEELGGDLVLEAAKNFRDKQVNLVVNGIRRVLSLHELSKTKMVLTGVGRKILKEAASVMGFKEIVDFADVASEEAALMTPAFGVGSLVLEALEGGRGN